MSKIKHFSLLAGLAGLFAGAAQLRAADAPTVKFTMEFRPLHGDIEIDTPEPKSYAQCKVDVIREGKTSGYIVTGPTGQPIRRFMDSNGDNKVDQWSYYKNGLEVYRDIDANFNNKIDQSRWLNLGGMRWGIDTNEDGKIDVWKMISAEEVSRIAIKALVSQDASLLAPLLITKDDLKELGIKGSLEQKVLVGVADPAAKLRKAIANSKIIHARTTWMRFDASAPSVILAERYKTPDDLVVYENGMAIVETGDPAKPGLVQIGELLRIGNVWKLTEIPSPLEAANAQINPGAIMYFDLGAGAATGDAPVVTDVPDPIQKLVERLKKLMENAPPPSAQKAVVEKHCKELDAILVSLVNESKTDEHKNQWMRQLLDTHASAVQVWAFKPGLARLKQLETEILKAQPKSPLAASAAYRRIAAEYFLAMHEAEDNDARQRIQEKWPRDLEDFLEKYPRAEESPDVVWHLAQSLEFGGKIEKSRTWYQRLASDFPESSFAAKATGATRRLDLNGKLLTLSGPALAGGSIIDAKQYRGKVLLVMFWDTNSKLTLEDLPLIKALHDEYRGQGFEIIGVNLNAVKEEVGPYLLQHGIRWPQIYEPGGTESPSAAAFGIIALPTMFLVDADGKVVNRSATVADLKSSLAETFKKK